MNQRYKNNLISHVRKSENGDWHNRFRYCSRRILTAVCFRETSESAYQKTDSVLLSPIGFYYAVFHIGIAMLSLDFATTGTELKRMGHKKLQHLIQNELIDKPIISNEFVAILISLKKLREYANYTLGGNMINDHKYYCKSIVPGLYKTTGKAFDIAINFIHSVCKEMGEKNLLPSFAPIRVCIGDDIGDDVYSMYLSNDDKKSVVEYLIKKNLTT